MEFELGRVFIVPMLSPVLGIFFTSSTIITCYHMYLFHLVYLAPGCHCVEKKWHGTRSFHVKREKSEAILDTPFFSLSNEVLSTTAKWKQGSFVIVFSCSFLDLSEMYMILCLCRGKR
jgi:hypothetical protein